MTIEAEAATVSGGTWVTTNHANYAGTGFADYGGDGSAVQWSVTRLAAGTVTLNFRYANGGATARPLTVYVNGLAVGSVTMPSTGSWDTWKVAAIGVTLSAGVNSIKAVAGPATGANVDSLTIVRNPNNPVPAGTISGFAYVDADGNGVYDHADTRVAGMQVYLDTNANGVLDTGETFVVTASDGSYGFANVTPGTYAVGEVPPGGYVPATATPPVTVAAGQAVSNVILPLKPASPTIDPSVVTIEGEAGTGTGGTFSARNHTGFTGNGFLDFGGSGSAGQWTDRPQHGRCRDVDVPLRQRRQCRPAADDLRQRGRRRPAVDAGDRLMGSLEKRHDRHHADGWPEYHSRRRRRRHRRQYR